MARFSNTKRRPTKRNAKEARKKATKATVSIEAAIRFSDVRDSRVLHRPRLLSDNGPCYVSKALKEYLEQEGMTHTRGRPYHPMTQG